MKNSLNFLGKSILALAFSTVFLFNMVTLIKSEPTSDGPSLEILNAQAEAQTETGAVNNHYLSHEDCDFEYLEWVGNQLVPMHERGIYAVCHYSKNSSCYASGDCERM